MVRLGALIVSASMARENSVAPAAARQAAPSPFETCASSADQPRTQAHVLCLYRVAVRHQRLPEVRERLMRLGAGSDAHPWPTLVLGYATQEDDEARAVSLYEAAARGFASSGDAEGEVLARHNLRNLYYRRGAADAAVREVTRALAAAEASGQPLVIARASVLEASHLVQTGGDMGRAYHTLQRARGLAFPDGPIGLRRTILLTLANASFYLDRFDETIAALQQHRGLRQEDGSTVDAATVAFNLLNARLTQAERRPRPGARDQLLHEATAVLAEVQQLQRPALVAQTHRVIADLTRTTNPALATSHLDRCLAIEQSLGQPELRAGCLWTRALLEARRDPQRADHASRAAIDALVATPGSPLLVYAWQARLRLVWQTMPASQAMQASLDALEAIERLRGRQEDEASRAALFSHWTRDYYWLAGRLLEADTPRSSEAFAVGERLRARVLLEHLARAGLPAAAARSAAVPPAGAVPFATLKQVQSELDATEALLWYSMAPWQDVYGEFGGGAWLVVVTRDRISVHRLATTSNLQGQVAALIGLLRDRELPAEHWTPAATRLGRMLLEPAVSSLADGVSRLVIVSDGDLHALPFEALVPVEGRAPLGEQYDVTVVPSATLWQHVRKRRTPAPARAALVLADPELPRPSRGEVPLPPLPWARREARAIARTLRLNAGQVLQGRDASEHGLKQAAMQEVAVLHLAAHARADEAFPDRSAVFLHPGATTEDGRLEPREIAGLQLHGRLVVLSACESAGGSVLSGEGPLSLARAFFAGGAGAIVATRWPLRDDDAAFLMATFYEALEAGHGPAGALRLARRDAVAHGLPASAWAGLVLLGDGRRAVLAGTTSRSIVPASTLVVLALMAIAGGGIAAIVRRRRAGARK
jgi:CHAT domain-containing protein